MSSMAPRYGKSPSASDGPDSPQGAQAVTQALTLLKAASAAEKDAADKATLDKCVTALQGFLAAKP